MKLPFTIRSSSRAAIAASALSLFCSLPLTAQALPVMPAPQVPLNSGTIEGERLMAGARQLNVFRGIAYAAPPTGDNRWREPQPLGRWAGIRDAKLFAPRCMQAPVKGITFRSLSMSEDCLYLNVWTPVAPQPGKLPVLVYFHGGGFVSGDASEPRFDGAHLASRGIIVVTVNYRLGVFGFLMHPDASHESSSGAAGNYGLLDQQAALRWVRENIARFGGDPKQVTIGGETAGAMAVSAHMASPLSRGLFARAIGESGGAFAPNAFWPRDRAEKVAKLFTQEIGADSFQALRSMPADKLLQAVGPNEEPNYMFWPSIDGHFLPDTPASIFSAGGQAPVPLLLGSNSQESHFRNVAGPLDLTPENWSLVQFVVFGNHRSEAQAFYPGNDEDEIKRSASELANDLTVSHSVWQWMDLHRQTGRAPVYFYLFTHPRPPALGTVRQPTTAENQQPETGAPHRSEIVYALGNLDEERRYRWTKDDRTVSRIFSGYIEQFVKTGSPNGVAAGQLGLQPITRELSKRDLPDWPAVRQERDGLARQVIDTNTHTIWDSSEARQALMERVMQSRPGDLAVRPSDR